MVFYRCFLFRLWQILFWWMQFPYCKDKHVLTKALVALPNSKFDMSILSECPHPDRELCVETLN